ncbi:U6 snRNA-associated Sm-like protein LSm2 isoform X2 [Apodemus sylvaticus]|uniref:U6 snRNA-associated Sm-like protein LSm2 isoform X2 n=1 Tax=Apodemus sylvaticus TaxID=10129 RepID=UPI00224457FC|nr:U6 snRNA-associated Sm-like protein LSm2 isoform X2 [Apodemus sylvaticus]
MVFWGKLSASPRESPRAPGENGKLALHFRAGDQDFVRLFYSFFKSLVGKDVVVELKNDLSICGTLHSVDQYLNIKLTDISVTDPEKYPHMGLSYLSPVISQELLHQGLSCPLCAAAGR